VATFTVGADGRLTTAATQAINITYAQVSNLSSWAGSTAITTLGTIATGTWSATTIAVNKGGTGVTSTTAYAVLCGGTTGTNPLQSIASVGTAGQVLTSNGAGNLPTFQAAAGGSAGWARTFAMMGG